MDKQSANLDLHEPVLVTGASGFIGPAVVESLARHGFRHIRAFTRPSSSRSRLDAIASRYKGTADIEIVQGNLLSNEDCEAAVAGCSVIFHLATGGGKSFAAAYMNSVITTRNLLEASLKFGNLRRFVNISSFAVYSNTNNPHGRVLDEASPLETNAAQAGDSYCFAKLKQDELVMDYGKRFGLPYVIVRPGSVFGPGKDAITGRVGLDTFGFFIHLGGLNRIPLTYVDNCADGIALAGLTPGIEGEVFNIVDDDLPTSRSFLKLYKRNVRKFRSFYVPRSLTYLICTLWEKYCIWSEGQLPMLFSRRRWNAEWKQTRYTNRKLKEKLGWTPKVSMKDGLERFFQNCRESRHA